MYDLPHQNDISLFTKISAMGTGHKNTRFNCSRAKRVCVYPVSRYPVHRPFSYFSPIRQHESKHGA